MLGFFVWVVYMIRYTVSSLFFFTLLPCLYELKSTDYKIRTIKKLKIYAIFPCFGKNEVGSFSHFIIKAESQEESSITNIKIYHTWGIAYYVMMIL